MNKSFVWDVYARFYDFWQPKNEFKVDEIILDKVPNIINSKVVDCGCGTGDLAFKLSTLGAKVIAIDISEKMLKTAKKKYGKGIEWRQGDFTNYLNRKIPQESIDFIVAKKSLYDVSKVPNFFSNAYGVLKENRPLVIVLPNKKRLSYLKINQKLSLTQILKYGSAKIANSLKLVHYDINPAPILDSFNDYFKNVKSQEILEGTYIFATGKK